MLSPLPSQNTSCILVFITPTLTCHNSHPSMHVHSLFGNILEDAACNWSMARPGNISSLQLGNVCATVMREIDKPNYPRQRI
ncbi:hypothetical protein BDV25DRAFT_158987 [Aspergillus avenaceus]|uniref:Uncharacterized protein n=1 Tax=Aspergillus avenaceus TaxID=36643 RepID=A0A5N6TP85_ASPAV|nr:hypothetical protein BDV25DRAFT_158987 [Aspergillus avenaceus]